MIQEDKLERWSEICDSQGAYEISSLGRVKSKERYYIRRGVKVVVRERILTNHLGKRGYPEVKIRLNGKSRNKTIHRLIAIAFIDNPNGYPHINHKDGDKTNFAIENLEWCTHLQNMRHAFASGLIIRKPQSYEKQKRRVRNIKTNQTYDCLRSLCDEKGLKINTIRSYLLGTRTNKTDYEYI